MLEHARLSLLPGSIGEFLVPSHGACLARCAELVMQIKKSLVLCA
jgi:hypothetical protein